MKDNYSQHHGFIADCILDDNKVRTASPEQLCALVNFAWEKKLVPQNLPSGIGRAIRERGNDWWAEFPGRAKEEPFFYVVVEAVRRYAKLVGEKRITIRSADELPAPYRALIADSHIVG